MRPAQSTVSQHLKIFKEAGLIRWGAGWPSRLLLYQPRPTQKAQGFGCKPRLASSMNTAGGSHQPVGACVGFSTMNCHGVASSRSMMRRTSSRSIKFQARWSSHGSRGGALSRAERHCCRPGRRPSIWPMPMFPANLIRRSARGMGSRSSRGATGIVCEGTSSTQQGIPESLYTGLATILITWLNRI